MDSLLKIVDYLGLHNINFFSDIGLRKFESRQLVRVRSISLN